MSDNKVTDKIDGIQTEYNRVKAAAASIDVVRGACGRMSSQLNPIAPNLHTRDNKVPRSKDSRLSEETTDGSPPTLNH